MFKWLKEGGSPQVDPIYARVGEIICCTNGHEICEVLEDIKSGELFSGGKKLGKWRQAPPQPGAQTIHCDICKGLWWHGVFGQHFHFKGTGWRRLSPEDAQRKLSEMKRPKK